MYSPRQEQGFNQLLGAVASVMIELVINLYLLFFQAGFDFGLFFICNATENLGGWGIGGKDICFVVQVGNGFKERGNRDTG